MRFMLAGDDKILHVDAKTKEAYCFNDTLLGNDDKLYRLLGVTYYDVPILDRITRQSDCTYFNVKNVFNDNIRDIPKCFFKEKYHRYEVPEEMEDSILSIVKLKEEERKKEKMRMNCFNEPLDEESKTNVVNACKGILTKYSESKARKEAHILTPKIKNIFVNEAKRTIVVTWDTDEVTKVVCDEKDTWDLEKGISMAITKYVLGNNYNSYNILTKYIKSAKNTAKVKNKVIEAPKEAPAPKTTTRAKKSK